MAELRRRLDAEEEARAERWQREDEERQRRREEEQREDEELSRRRREAAEAEEREQQQRRPSRGSSDALPGDASVDSAARAAWARRQSKEGGRRRRSNPPATPPLQPAGARSFEAVLPELQAMGLDDALEVFPAFRMNYDKCGGERRKQLRERWGAAPGSKEHSWLAKRLRQCWELGNFDPADGAEEAPPADADAALRRQ